MASRSLSVPSKNFLIPELNIQANDSQLKNLQHRMLAQIFIRHRKHYNKQIHDREVTTKPKFYNAYNPQSIDPDTFRDINQMQSDLERSAKIQLAQEYQKQINRKQQMKKDQKYRTLVDENIRLKTLEGLQENQLSRARQNQEFMRQNTLKMLEEATDRRKVRKIQKQREKQQFNRRYSNTNDLDSGKQSFFREYYNSVSQAQKQIEKNYVEKWQPSIQRRQQQRIKVIQSPYNNQQLLRQKLEMHNKNSIKMKNDWKQILEEQIKQKAAQTQAQKRHKYSRYTQNKYENVHHPINNPVDFKITHDNKYIMKELNNQKNNHGTLARSGSQSIFN